MSCNFFLYAKIFANTKAGEIRMNLKSLLRKYKKKTAILRLASSAGFEVMQKEAVRKYEVK